MARKRPCCWYINKVKTVISIAKNGSTISKNPFFVKIIQEQGTGQNHQEKNYKPKIKSDYILAS